MVIEMIIVLLPITQLNISCLASWYIVNPQYNFNIFPQKMNLCTTGRSSVQWGFLLLEEAPTWFSRGCVGQAETAF